MQRQAETAAAVPAQMRELQSAIGAEPNGSSVPHSLIPPIAPIDVEPVNRQSRPGQRGKVHKPGQPIVLINKRKKQNDEATQEETQSLAEKRLIADGAASPDLAQAGTDLLSLLPIAPDAGKEGKNLLEELRAVHPSPEQLDEPVALENSQPIKTARGRSRAQSKSRNRSASVVPADAEQAEQAEGDEVATQDNDRPALTAIHENTAEQAAPPVKEPPAKRTRRTAAAKIKMETIDD